jgi:hypothetical protein
MATYLDEATLQAIEADLAAAHHSLAHGDLDMKGATKAGVKVLETVVPAALFSYANARQASGELKLGPLPVDLGVGIGLAVLSLFDVAGDWSEDLLNVGIGALCSYGARTGAAFGAAAQLGQSAPLTHGAGQFGMPSITHGLSGPVVAHAGQGSSTPVDLTHGAMAPGSPVPPGTQRFMVQALQ